MTIDGSDDGPGEQNKRVSHSARLARGGLCVYGYEGPSAIC